MVARPVDVLRAARELTLAGRVLAGTGLVGPVRPDRLLGMALALARHGVTPATAYAAAAARSPDRPAVVDDAGTLTFAEVEGRSNALARGLRRLGVRQGDTVALLCRNSAALVLAQVAVAKLGGDLVYLNTGFAGPQLADVLAAEDAVAVVADVEFAEHLRGSARPVVLAPHDGHDLPSWAADLSQLAAGDGSLLPPNRRSGRHVVLTSGTTGRPKGAARSLPGGSSALEPVTALLSVLPLRAREPTVLAAPMFHAWGFAHLVLGQLLESTLVLSRRFAPERALQLVERHRATALVAVPVMVQRMTELSARARRHDTSSLRVVALSGSALSPVLARRFMDEYGDVLYDLYGSTEVAYATVATPRDIREGPGTVGRVLHGVTLRLVDDHGRDVPPGQVGQVYVGNALTFAGYTGGGDKDRLGGLVATGDVGRFDAHGRLFIEGRADDMIVSGGENVYPAEVEECLRTHPGVADVAVVGAPDEQYGQRLVAHVVRADGAEADGEALRAYVKANLANYKVPREVVFHDALPRNETGKVVKRRLQGR